MILSGRTMILSFYTILLITVAVSECHGEPLNPDLSIILKRLDTLERRVLVLEEENTALKNENKHIWAALQNCRSAIKPGEHDALGNVNQNTTINSLSNKANIHIRDHSATYSKSKENQLTKELKKRLLMGGVSTTPSTPIKKVAFRAYLKHEIPTTGFHQAIEFDDVLLNIGHAYDPRHGYFTAPTRGVYLVSALAVSDYKSRLSLFIVQNGNTIESLDTGSDNDYASQSKSFPVLMEEGDMIWVRSREGFEGSKLIAVHNMFTAVLLFAL